MESLAITLFASVAGTSFYNVADALKVNDFFAVGWGVFGFLSVVVPALYARIREQKLKADREEREMLLSLGPQSSVIGANSATWRTRYNSAEKERKRLERELKLKIDGPDQESEWKARAIEAEAKLAKLAAELNEEKENGQFLANEVSQLKKRQAQREGQN